MFELLNKAETLLKDFKLQNNLSSSEVLNNKNTDNLDKESLSCFFDHTLLKSDVTKQAISLHCMEAIDYKCKAVCVHPAYVPQVKQLIAEAKSQVKTCAVVGFPLGANLTSTKVDEIKRLDALNVEEIDFVAPLYLIKQKNWQKVAEEFAFIRKSTKACLKVILETALLNDTEKVLVSLIAIDKGLEYVKTSTGFLKGGASVYDVSLLRFTAQNLIKVKASGGIRDLKFAKALIRAGADRLGASATIKILKEC